MIGPRGLAEALGGFLVAEMPANVDRLAAENGSVVDDPFSGNELTLDAMPVFVATVGIPTQGVAYDHWPFVVVIVRRMVRQVRVNVAPDASVDYERTYDCQFWCWARGDGYTITAAVRDRMMLALGETLLRAQSFGTITGRVDEASWSEEYSDVGGGDDPDLHATQAAGYISTQVTITETMAPPRPVRGAIGRVQLTAESGQVEHPAWPSYLDTPR